LNRAWKIGSFGFARVSACGEGQNQMCQCGGLKLLACLICFLAVLVNRFAYLNKKKCAVGKIKNTERLAMSVGLLAVPLQFGLYVVHLSKWFVCVFNV
jgi:hypothetical protein